VDELDGHGRARRRLGRTVTWTSRIATLAVLAILAADAWFAFDVFVGDGGSGPRGSSSEPSYGDLEIFDEAGTFGGRVTIRNPLEHEAEVLIDVDVFDGEQNVGELSGSVAVKPDSESVVELTGVDDYVDLTDTTVKLTGWT
jgi:hypothetical protein